MMDIGSVENHRAREGGALVYPVYSRRSQGLSLGINLFPDQKRCSFDCPYCEVFPFKTDIRFSLELMEVRLRQELGQIKTRGVVVKDICFSGNGEPTGSPDFPAALEAAFRIRDDAAPEADLVVITNGTGLLEENLFEVLRHAASRGLKLWLKLDAGTENWYHVINRSKTPYQSLVNKIREFTVLAPITIQTMRCKVNRALPPPEELEAWERLAAELAALGAKGTGIESIQLYSKARPAPEDPLAEILPVSYLETQALSLKKALKQAGVNPAVHIFP